MKKDLTYKRIFILFQSQTDPIIISALSYTPALINRQQKKILNLWLKEKANSWVDIETRQQFVEKLADKRIIKFIDNNGLKEATDSFNRVCNSIIKNGHWLELSRTISEYKSFILEVKSNSKYIVDMKDYIEEVLIGMDNLYKKYIENINSSLTKVQSEKIKIPDTEIDKLKLQILNSPFSLVNRILPLTEVGIFKNMYSHSEFTLIDLVEVNYIEDVGIETKNYSKKFSEIDSELMKFMEEIKVEDKGINSLNKENEVYLQYFFDDINLKLNIYFELISLNFLYEIVKKKVDNDTTSSFSMIDLIDENVKIAHLTQLFPMLEEKIRQLGEKKNIFTQKELNDGVISFKDPTSILTQIIGSNDKRGKKGFKDCGIELFLYLCLYSRNALNIRNKCIHARDYIYGDRLVFGLKISLFCLLLLMD
ncbi:hypothetical protein [Lactobacillus taiwanensis]|uniref:hypothetical protein n=1 Tax=Lactobacillus taiwanensis TaxID=508451 RepID=UPI00321F7136